MLVKVLVLLCICRLSWGYSDRSMVSNPEDCCVEKMVDMEMYILSEIPSQELAQANGCASACIYKRLDDDGQRFCFGAAGPSTVNACTTRKEDTTLGLSSDTTQRTQSTTTSTAKSAVTQTTTTTTTTKTAVTVATTKSSTTGEVALIIGGMDFANMFSNEVETYGSCSITVNNLDWESDEMQAAELDGFVYTCGGYQDYEPTARCLVLGKDYRWTQGPKMLNNRGAFTLNRVGNKLIAVGGHDDSFNILAHLEVLYSGSSNWEKLSASLKQTRRSHCTVTISDTDIAVIGGMDDNYNLLNTVERVNTKTGAVSSMQNIPKANSYLVCEFLDNIIYIAGGSVDYFTVNSVYSLDTSSNQNSWTPIASLNFAREEAVSAVLNGQFVVFGGYDSEDYEDIPSYETYKDGVWTVRPMVQKSYFSVAVLPCP